MKIKNFKTLCSIVGFTILLFACSKDTHTSAVKKSGMDIESEELHSPKVSDFLTKGFIEKENKHISNPSDRVYDPHIEAVINDLYTKDAQDPFIEALVDAYGYPSWQYAIVPDQMEGALAITAFMHTTDDFVSAVMTSAIREDGSVDYGFYPREAVLSATYDLPLSNLITVTQNVMLADTIFNTVDCELQDKLLEEIEDKIEEDGLKLPESDDSRDCLEVSITWEQCTDYYSVSGDGTTTFLYTSCTTWTETYTTGCGTGYPGDNPGGGTTTTNNDDGANGGPRPDPIEDGGDQEEDEDNGTTNTDTRTAIERLCDAYPADCDCIMTADNESDAKLIHRLITDHDDLLDPCNPGSSIMKNILSSVCAKNNGNLTSSTLLEEINTTLMDNPLIDTYNSLINGASTGCAGTNEVNDVIDNMDDCNIESFTQAYNAYFGITSAPAQQTQPTLTIGSQLCATIFNINEVGDDIHSSGGISGLNFDVVNSLGQTITISTGHLVLFMDNNINNCPGSSIAILMTQAINEAIEELRGTMSQQISYDNLPFTQSFQTILEDIMADKSAECVGHGYGGSIDSDLTNTPGSWTANCGVQFTQFTNDYISMNNGADCQ